MRVITDVQTMQNEAWLRRREGKRLALVPTMGALHAGHLALVEAARLHAGYIIVSIFVNPTQFGPGEDFESYPRSLEADIALLERANVPTDAVFAPSVQELYPPEASTWVQVSKLDEHLCGRFRPGHFRGVTTVVAKLFNTCNPHVAVFGMKDAQQFLILRRMVVDLCYNVEIVGVPTVREPGGLAMSSRNKYLTSAQRMQAPVIYQALTEARRRVEEGEQQVSAIVQEMLDVLGRTPQLKVQYAEVADRENLRPLQRIEPGQEILVAIAGFLGQTRLIDNLFLTVPRSKIQDAPK